MKISEFGPQSSYKNFDISIVGYGIERMNKDVSRWMNGEHGDDTAPLLPFIATRGYDSVVWNRLYSRDTSDLPDYQIDQASIFLIYFCDENLLFVSRKMWMHSGECSILINLVLVIRYTDFSRKHYKL